MLEELFQLVENCGIDYAVAWDMPVAYRRWWFVRKSKELHDRQAAKASAQRDANRGGKG